MEKRIEIIKTEIRAEINTKLNILEKNVLDKDKTIDELVKKVASLEKTILDEKPLTDKANLLICEFCQFEAKSLSGLKVHMKRKHTFHEKDTFPTKCDLCEKVIEDKLEMKKHMRRHSYICVSYKCLYCDFICETDLGMEVHIGKEHADGFDCGLCGFKEQSLENLETHIYTCE